MGIIRKIKAPKKPHQGWALIRVGLTYQSHMGESCADRVL